MEPRLNLAATLATSKAMKHILAAGKAIADSALPHATRDLVMIRVSQINGCGFCVDCPADANMLSPHRARLSTTLGHRRVGVGVQRGDHVVQPGEFGP